MSTEELRKQIIQKAWEDEFFKQKLLADPKGAIEEAFGVSLPAHIDVTVVEETENRYYLVLPPNPADLQDENTVGVPAW